MSLMYEEIGRGACLEQLAEECCELGKAALKLSRIIRDENPTPKGEALAVADLAEEIADVQNCIEVVRSGENIDPEQIRETIEHKNARWKMRIEEMRRQRGE